VRALGGVEAVEVDFSANVTRGAKPSGPLPGVRNVIAVGAGKGGVGKSTIAVLTAVGLARAGARVGLLDADVYGPSVPKMMGIEDEKPAVSGAGNSIEPIVAHGVKCISIGLIIPPDQPVIWRGPMIHGTVKQFLEQVEWGELDYLIVDLPPGTGDVPLTLSQSIPTTGAVVVCTPQDVALADAMRAARMYMQLKVDVLGVVENMSYFIAPDTGKEYDLFGKGGAKKAAAALRVPFLGSVPINVAVRTSGDRGTPADVFEGGQQGLSAAVIAMVESVAAEVSRRHAKPSRPVSLTIENT
jgi:ATP-binding protein involved in chromosome partitioning